jgi:hypothetical protein
MAIPREKLKSRIARRIQGSGDIGMTSLPRALRAPAAVIWLKKISHIAVADGR